MWPDDVARMGSPAVAIWALVAAAGGELVETVNAIAARCGMSERTARRYLRQMAEAGHIILAAMRGRNGHVRIILVGQETAPDAATVVPAHQHSPQSGAVSLPANSATVTEFGQQKADTVTEFGDKNGHSGRINGGKADTVSEFAAKSFNKDLCNETTGLTANGGYAPVGANGQSSKPANGKGKPKRSWRYGSKKRDREAVIAAFSEALKMAPPKTKQLRSQWEYGAHVLLKELGGVDEVKRRLAEFARRRAAGEFQFTITGPISVANVLKNLDNGGGGHAQPKGRRKFNPAEAAKSAEWKPQTDAEREWWERIRKRGNVPGVQGADVGT